MDKETLVSLINLLKENEYRIESNGDITVWIDFYSVKELTEIFGADYFCEGGIDVTLLYDTIAFELEDLLYGVADEEDWKVIRKELM